MKLQDITDGSVFSGSNASDYCVISQKEVKRRDSLKSNKSGKSEMETSGSSVEKRSRKLTSQFKRIFSVRNRKSKSSQKSGDKDKRRSVIGGIISGEKLNLYYKKSNPMYTEQR